MESIFMTLILALIFSYTFLKSISLIRNYIQARRSGFPVCITPIPHKSPIWMALGPILRPLFRKFLPERIYERIDLVIPGWEFRRRSATCHRFGRVCLIVTPDASSLGVEDPAVGQAILKRRKDFLQGPDVARILGLFGHNVFQANGEDWQRQRRIVAPHLNERISEVVWKESCQRAQSMIDYLIEHPGGQTLSGLRCLAINVIGKAGYGQKQAWSPELQDHKGEDARSVYFKAISLVADQFLCAVFVPTRLLRVSFMPQQLQSLGRHKERMPAYTRRLLEEERQAPKAGCSSKSNFLSMLVEFSDQEKRAKSTSHALSDDEISGNLFVISTAAYETTANTMGYAVMHLAAYPEWQAWVREEVRNLDPDMFQWKYEEVFPRCHRTLALMFETLRLYTPTAPAIRHVAKPQRLSALDENHLLLPPMDISVASPVIHCDPGTWGSDALEFKPSRWIDAAGRIVIPSSNIFLPWSAGPRVCPGMKMSQVEFVAVIATLFRHATCEPQPVGHEDLEALREGLRSMMRDSAQKLTLQIRDPRSVKLRWILDP